MVAGLLVGGLGTQLSPPSDEPETTTEGQGTTAATFSEIPTTSNMVTAVTSTADRLAQQERTSTTGGDVPSNAVEGEAETTDDPDRAPDESKTWPSLPPLTFPPMAPPTEVPLDWDGEPIEFRVLALNSQQYSFAVVDLADRTMRVYLPGHHNMSLGSVMVAAYTPRGDVLFNQAGERDVYVVPDGDFSATPSTISPSRRVIEAEYGPPDNYADIQALADRSGEKVWLLQWTGSDTTLVDLVAIEDNTAVSTVELDGAYWISGLSEDDLYVVRGGEYRDDRVVSPNGAVREVSSCRDSPDYGDLRTLAVFRDHFSCLTLDDQHLIFYDETTGQVDVFTASGSDRWDGVFLPEIPAANTTGVHSDQVLLRLRGPDVNNPPYHVTKSIYVADLTEHTVRLVYENEHEQARFITPLGIVDGLLISRAGSAIVVIDIETGEWHSVVDLPEGYFIYDAK